MNNIVIGQEYTNNKGTSYKITGKGAVRSGLYMESTLMTIVDDCGNVYESNPVESSFFRAILRGELVLVA
jgi:hypothetical protein